MKKFCYLQISILLMIIFSSCSTSETIEFTQKANGSAGNFWEYELSNNDIIQEISYTETQVFLSPGYRQNWTFNILNEGDVTIQWLAYKGGSLSEKDSYSITYHFEENGEYSTISES